MCVCFQGKTKEEIQGSWLQRGASFLRGLASLWAGAGEEESASGEEGGRRAGWGQGVSEGVGDKDGISSGPLVTSRGRACRGQSCHAACLCR